jgi:hypothetical protein
MKSNINNSAFGRLAAKPVECPTCSHSAHEYGKCLIQTCVCNNPETGKLIIGSFKDVSGNVVEQLKKAA